MSRDWSVVTLVGDDAPGDPRREHRRRWGNLYERAGVEEYWLADPETDRLRVYRRGPDGFDGPDERAAEFGHAADSALFPGLSVPLAELFA